VSDNDAPERYCGCVSDSNAQRQRRHKKHIAGDHSECKPSRCPAVALPASLAPAAGRNGERHGELTEVILDVLAELPFAETDPRFVISAVTLKLAAEFDKTPSVPLAQEIRRNVMLLRDQAAEAATSLTAIRARVSVKSMELLLGRAFPELHGPDWKEESDVVREHRAAIR
jgi:hypothetical protein